MWQTLKIIDLKHTHRGMERHGEGQTQSDAHKDKERERQKEGGRG